MWNFYELFFGDDTWLIDSYDRNLFYSKKTLREYTDVLGSYGTPSYHGKYTDKQLWEMKYGKVLI